MNPRHATAPLKGPAIVAGSRPPIQLDALALRLINDYQHGLPFCGRPYAAMADTLGSTEEAVLASLRDLSRRRMMSRIGPVFEHSKAGASTLAAMVVPAHRLDAVAHHVSQYAEVNHNYERDHEWNLWFVVTAPGRDDIDDVLKKIERTTGLDPISLPMLRSFHIDLGFPIAFTSDGKITLDTARQERSPTPATVETKSMSAVAPLTFMSSAQRLDLRRWLEQGLPLTPRPYQALAWWTRSDEMAVIAQVRAWHKDGLFRRHGIVLKHRELGIAANLMLVMDIDDSVVEEVGARLAREPGITLCYQRARRLPLWRYNLYCMIHGQDQRAVNARSKQLLTEHGLGDVPHQLLFSLRAFKQRGARFTPQDSPRSAVSTPPSSLRETHAHTAPTHHE